MNEIVARRTRNAKVYDIGDGRRRVVVAQHAVHYRDEQNAWRTIQADVEDDGVEFYTVTRHSYNLKMDHDFPRLRILHPSGAELVARLAKIDGQPLNGSFISQREPEFRRIRYLDVSPGVDCTIAFRPDKVRMSIYVNDELAARSFTFEATSAELGLFGYGFDMDHRDNIDGTAAARPPRDFRRPVRVVPDPPEPEINIPGTRMRVTRTWTGEVAVRNPVTRIRSWSSDPADVVYPVRIGGI